MEPKRLLKKATTLRLRPSTSLREHSGHVAKKLRSFCAAIVVLLLLLSAPSAQAQCPMCKAAVESEHGQAPNETAKGLNTAILYLFALPYSAISVIVISVIVTRRMRKNKGNGSPAAA